MDADEGQPASRVREFWTEVRRNLRFENISIWDEVSGSMGDLGTFLPLLLTLAFIDGVDVGSSLIFTGLYNIVTGVVFGIPMPVQPMKYIYAAAIQGGDPMTMPQIMAAGLCTSLVLLACGATGLLNVATRLFPTPVIRGFQLSQGIVFGITAVNYIVYRQDVTSGKTDGMREWTGTDGIALALTALAFVVLVSGPGDDMVADRFATGIGEEGSVRGRFLGETLLQNSDIVDNVAKEDVEDLGRPLHGAAQSRARSRAVPSALIVFAVGIVLALLRDPSALSDMQLGPPMPKLVSISWEDWKIGFFRGASAQIPLSLISTVVAVTKLSQSLFPEKTNVTASAVPCAVGIFNCVGCWFGTIPIECGASGLAAQFRFGARDGWAVVFLGASKLFVGLLLGSSLLRVLAAFPIGLLGVILLLAGSELAMFCRDQTSRPDAFVMVVCTTAVLSGFSAPLGILCGLGVHLLLQIRQKWFSSTSSYR